MNTEQTMTGTRMPIKKGNKGLGDLVRGMTVPVPERERKAQHTGEAWLEDTLKEYNSAFDIKKATYPEIFNEIMTQSLPVLTSGQINQFIEATIEYEEHENYLGRTGVFASALIQTAYNAGHNDFVLEPKGTQPLDWIGAYLKGTEKNPLRLTNNTQTGECCGWEAEHVIITNNTITGRHCGWLARHSTFKTNNPETLENMAYYLKDPSDKKVIFIHPDGTEEEIANHE